MSTGRRIQIPHHPNPSAGEAYSNTTPKGKPLLFQVVDPTNRPMWPYLLAMHVNPKSFNESFNKSKNVVMTYGGFVEFDWPDELDTISASGSTGAFVGPYSGLVSGSESNNFGNFQNGGFPSGKAAGRKRTMAWERQEDLLDLFRNNGNVYNGVGQPVIRGRVMCIYDRGVYVGHFTSLSPKEDDEHAYSFELDWEFTVESSIYVFPNAATQLKPGQAVSPGSYDSRRIGNEVDTAISGAGNGPPVGEEPFQTQADFEESLINESGINTDDELVARLEQQSGAELQEEEPEAPQDQALPDDFDGLAPIR